MINQEHRNDRSEIKGEKASAMKSNNRLILSTSPLSQTAKKPCRTVSLTRRHWFLYGGRRRYSTEKERDSETGLHYYGARYLDGRTGRWISGDPAVGEYVPEAPVDDEARKRNGNLPGMGGVFNYVNLHAYHYAGNNPVKYVDPDGEIFGIDDAIGIGVITGIAAALTTMYILATITIKNIGKLAQEELSRKRTATEEHHSFPVFLGGNESQELVPMERSRHVNLHKDLRVFLRNNYPGMEAKPGNGGSVIRLRYTLEERKEAMARFYLTHIDAYADAANQFFTNNPDTLNDVNTEWAKENALEAVVKRYPLRLLNTPTEE